MLFTYNKKETAKERLLKAYEDYLEAKKQLVKETGWNFYTNQTIESYASDEAERNDFVKKIVEIETKFNTK